MNYSLIDKIKDTVSIADYMQREHGARIAAGRCKSFRAGAKNPTSMLVNERDWYDFGSGIGGDIIDLAAYDRFDGNKGQAIAYLAEQWGLGGQLARPDVQVVFNRYLGILDAATTAYQKGLQPHHLQYLRGRGLTDDTIRDLRLGWADNPCEELQSLGYSMEDISASGILSFHNRLMVPYLRNGKTAYLIGRASVWEDQQSQDPDAKYKKLQRTDYSEHPIWGWETLSRKGVVVIAEGIFDAISCWQEGYAVITAVTGRFSNEQKKDLFASLKGRDVLLCMDYDPETKAGQKFTFDLGTELFEHGIRVSAVFLEGDKVKQDLNQLYAAKPEKRTLERLFRHAQAWDDVQLHEIVMMDSEQERCKALATFLRRCARVFDWPTVAQLVAKATETREFPEIWLREFAKTLNKAPKELDTVREFKAKFDCVFHEALGWYEYRPNATVWERVSEYTIKQKIAELLGQFRTARGVESVYKLLKGELIRDELFDQQAHLINFPNGMYDLTTGELKPHSREYYSSIQMAYAYDERAMCPNWDSFIEDVTGGDSTRFALLQEMIGYCLTKDVRYQKCFCLIGGGANGKSVLLHVLEALVGEDYTSHIEIAFLNSEFQRIKLLRSMVNICNDMKSDVSGTESYLKAIVAGDPINGCYKGQDFVDFHPFCKMVFSTNRMLTAREVDYSFLRRFCFVRFPMTFTDIPLNAYEMKKDPRILDKLLAELPGIFNWGMAGLANLRAQDGFTVTSDQQELSGDLYKQANPLLSFVEDVVGNGNPAWRDWLQRKDVYAEYNRWCVETNSKPMAARTFWSRLRDVFPFDDKKASIGRMIRFTDPDRYVEDNQ